MIFLSINQNNPYLSAIQWIKESSKHKYKYYKKLYDTNINTNTDIKNRLNQTVPTKLQPHLTTKKADGSIQINLQRYEYFIYRQLNESLRTGKIYLEDSLQYRSLSQELVTLEEKDNIISKLNIPALTQPITIQLNNLFLELNQLWQRFGTALYKNKLKHLRFDKKDKILHLKKTRNDQDESVRHRFYGQLPFCDIIDVLRFVNQHTNFLSAFTHVQPRYSKTVNK